jgi:nucleotide-binding universal stress UspA family protein
MKTYLVPTDFSETAKQAARYALELLKQQPLSKMILFNAYDRHGYGIDGTPLQLDETAERNLAVAALNNQRSELLALFPAAQIEIAAYPGSLEEATEAAAANAHTFFMIMGINNSNAIEQLLVGSSTLQTVKKAGCPVMIIPESAKPRPIKKIAYATDLDDVEQSTPVGLLEDLCSEFDVSLDIVHYGTDYRNDAKTIMEHMLADCRPNFHFLIETSFIEAMNRFLEEQHIDLLVIVSRTHGFFENLFRKSHTKELAYHSAIPVMAVHEHLVSA